MGRMPLSQTWTACPATPVELHGKQILGTQVAWPAGKGDHSPLPNHQLSCYLMDYWYTFIYNCSMYYCLIIHKNPVILPSTICFAANIIAALIVMLKMAFWPKFKSARLELVLSEANSNFCKTRSYLLASYSSLLKYYNWRKKNCLML